jgi:predicted KAP-like P-loop ATPase
MNQEEFINFLTIRINELKEIKSKIGNTGSRSSEIALNWIDGLITVNENLLKRIYH